VVAKVEHHGGELFPSVGFIVTNLALLSRAVVPFYNKRGTAEQWIKEGKQAVKMTRLSCHRFRSNEVRLWLSVIAYTLGNLWRRLVLPRRIAPRGRVRNRQEKTWGSKQGDGEVSEKSYGKRVKVPVDSIPKAHTWLPDGALTPGAQNCGCERAGGYTAVVRDAKMEILVWKGRRLEGGLKQWQRVRQLRQRNRKRSLPK